MLTFFVFQPLLDEDAPMCLYVRSGQGVSGRILTGSVFFEVCGRVFPTRVRGVVGLVRGAGSSITTL